jgi:site-specific DNA recombinase
MLQNPLYAGMACCNRVTRQKVRNPSTGQYQYVVSERPPDEWVRVPVPPIITPDEFEEVQPRLAENRKRQSGRPDRLFPLSGLIRCAECGRPYGGDRVKQYRYYRPQRPKHPAHRPDCRNSTWTAERAEEGILELLSQVARNPETIGAALKTLQEPDQRFREAAQERQRLEAELSRVERQLRILIEREIEEPDLASIHADLKAEKKALRQSLLEQLSKRSSDNGPASETPRTPARFKDVEAVCEEIARRLVEVKDPPTMRRVFLSLVEGVDVEPDGNLLIRIHSGKLLHLSG